MSDKNENGAYIYQPYGALTHPEQGEKLYGIAGIARLDIPGITKEMAEKLEMIFNHPELVLVMMELIDKLRFETMNGKWIRQTTRNELHEFYEKQLEE